MKRDSASWALAVAIGVMGAVSLFWALVLVYVLFLSAPGSASLAERNSLAPVGRVGSGTFLSMAIAVCAFGVSVYNSMLTRRHYRKTLRPIVNVDTDISPLNSRHCISLHNCGPGVAVIDQWSLTIGETTYEDLSTVSSRELTRRVGCETFIDFTHYFRGDALAAGQKMEIIGMTPPVQGDFHCQAFKKALGKVKIRFAFESVYDERWERIYDGAKEWASASSGSADGAREVPSDPSAGGVAAIEPWLTPAVRE